MEENQKNWHDKYYKLLFLIPVIIIVFSVVYMVNFHSENNDFIYKDITLTGGTSVTIYEKVDANDLKETLSGKLESIKTRSVSDLFTQEQTALIITTKSDGDLTKEVLEDYLGYDLIPGENADFEFTGSALSESFYKQLLTAILIAFVFMGIVVFIIFRTFVPSTAVILSALADILMTLTLVNILGMEMSTAGIVAFLMLIGYSVDTDILLTTRLLKRTEGSINKRIYSAFQTGITMTLTSLLAIIFALFIVRSFSVVLTQIFTILAIGLGFDILNTWITNVAIIKWYMEKKHKRGLQ
jgi:preprotein translocase subunit SecF